MQVSKKKLLIPRSDHACCIADDKIFIAGGEDSKGRVLQSMEMLDLNEFDWNNFAKSDVPLEDCGDMKLARKNFQMI
eukprot:CAMPEP_0116965084 /NCGR_PEP_ID=MMETSP0467-20121206/48987_1 /TAXON_ID=283647 /ORGANISM="Mesodinium pulex, Strain SPMC105" /LENGTH=76 /DNA_ID=CAMNT_0004654219 /DNA_START=736 /DNA_END=966 /DNA_ORIENTATION=+